MTKSKLGLEVEEPQQKINSLKTFAYSEISTSSNEIIAEFKNKGFIAISKAPNFEKAYKNFIHVAREFTNLPSEVQSQCTPIDSYARGWSRGIEVFNKRKDTYKGSYYVNIPEIPSQPNIWPHHESILAFQECYMEVAEIIHNVGEKILSLLLKNLQNTTCVARMLHYSAVPEGEDDGNPNWCGTHKDHGLFTGLGPEVYFPSTSNDNKTVDKPPNSGLYILNNPITTPNDDVILFQIGEALELATDGRTTATEHFVRKAYGGYERFTLAVFIQPKEDMILSCKNKHVLEKYEDRYTSDMTYKVWNDRSLARYNPDFDDS